MIVLKKILNICSKEAVILFFILGIFFTVFSTVSLHRYWQYSAWYYDFGIFYTAIASVAQLKAPIIDHYVFTNQNILGDHFHPIIFLISPLVALFQGGETLLIAQVLFVTFSGVFVYLTAKEILKKKSNAVAILILYFSFIGLHNALITEFHEVTLLPLPLSIFFYGMVKKNIQWYIFGLLGTLFTKETTFIIPFWFGALIALKNWNIGRNIDNKSIDLNVVLTAKKWKKIGLLTSLSSILYGALVLFVVIPAINGTGYYYFSDTLHKATQSFSIDALTLQSIFKTFLSFGFLPLFSPETVVPVFFNWASRVSRFGNFDLGMHYNAEVAPTLALATIYGFERVKKFILVVFKKNVKKKFIPEKYFSVGLLFLALLSLFFNVQVLKSPALLFTNRAFYQNTKNHEFLNTLIKNIPKDGVVMAQTNIAAKLGYRKVYMLRENYSDFNPDYIVVDERAGQEPNNFWGIEKPKELFITIGNDEKYELFYLSGDQKIYKKK